ncbi:MAG: UDP-N-acetylmuramate--L-alanine ligase, partial [Planctomycetota bacterium]
AASGAVCEGSDRAAGPFTEMLTEAGVNVSFDQSYGHLPESCDSVVFSAAIPPSHPQLLEAYQRGIPILSYAEALGRLMQTRTGVCIAGTHGKSTTTALLAHILISCGRDPSFIVGANCPQVGGGSRTGAASIHVPADAPAALALQQRRQSRSGRPGGATGPSSGESGSVEVPGLLLAEACEFNRSFHHHRPTVAAVMNLEEDHLDIYGSLDSIIEAFHEFARLLPDGRRGGYLLIGHESAHRSRVAAGLACEVETLGLSTQADWRFVFEPQSQQVRLYHHRTRRDEPVTRWSTPMPGEHNAANSAFAAVLAHRYGCSWGDISAAIECFQGIERRMQCLGERAIPGGRVMVYDDYGHHPTEIDSTLRALRAHRRPDRLVCVFQPHQHSRTRFLLDQFATSFSSADVVIVPEIYFVRDSEAEKQRVSAADLVDRLRRRGKQAMHLYPFAAIVEQLEIICRPGDLVVVMGAGPVYQVAHEFLANGDADESSSGAGGGFVGIDEHLDADGTGI